MLCLFTTDSFSSGIASNTASAPCTNNTLETYSGNSNLSADWQPNTINLTWYNEQEKLTVQQSAQSCVYDGTLSIPATQPTRVGYTFAGWKVRLPGTYTELEYIQADGGGQYINTGISPQSDNIVYKTSWLETQLEINACVFGSVRRNNGQGYWPGNLYHPSKGTTYLALAFSDKQCAQNNVIANQVNVAEIIIRDGQFVKTQNGVTCTQIYSGSVQTGNNIALFASLGTEYSKYTQLFYWRMYDNGDLVRDMIPARRNSDGVLGMYDIVTQTFFTNAGSGAFVAGPVVQ